MKLKNIHQARKIAQGARLHPGNRVSLSKILQQRFYCEKYKTEGRWISDGKTLSVFFHHGGHSHYLPFDAVFEISTLSMLCDAAVMKMEEYIENSHFEQDVSERW